MYLYTRNKEEVLQSRSEVVQTALSVTSLSSVAEEISLPSSWLGSWYLSSLACLNGPEMEHRSVFVVFCEPFLVHPFHKSAAYNVLIQ